MTHLICLSPNKNMFNTSEFTTNIKLILRLDYSFKAQSLIYFLWIFQPNGLVFITLFLVVDMFNTAACMSITDSFDLPVSSNQPD